jgi:hypothetical protein
VEDTFSDPVEVEADPLDELWEFRIYSTKFREEGGGCSGIMP